MKAFLAANLLVLSVVAHASSTNPIQKVIQMISDLQAKVIAEGDDVHKLYEKFAESCEDRSRELHFNIKTAKGEIADLTATVEKASAEIEALSTKVEELAGSTSENEAELKKATHIREKEHADFTVTQKELEETISAIERATTILERELSKGSSFAQLRGASGLQKALEAMVEGLAISTADASRLTALVQNSADDEDSGAPAAAVYESQSGGIVDALGGLLSKAEDQLAELRKEESESKHNFEMLKQSLEDQIKFASEDMDAAKKALAENEETKATADGDLSATSKDLAEDKKSLSELHHDCMTRASAYEDETKSRAEELDALAKAKKIVQEATSGSDGAEEQTYDLAQTSFLQVASMEMSKARGAIRTLRRMAFDHKSASLAQLVRRIEAAMRVGGSNPFAKVTSMISDMIKRLEEEAAKDAAQKAWCDKEMKETTEKKDDKETEIEKMSTKIDQMTAESAKLAKEVATLQEELGALTKEQAEMDQQRQNEKATFDKNKPEMEEGLRGIQLALKVLRDYYGKADGDHASADGAASGIIGLLEVAESDFSKGLAEMIAEEESAAAAYKKETDENEVLKAKKEQDRKYKEQESASLAKGAAELENDRSGVQTELDAVLEYFKEIKEKCVAKAPTYEEEKAARDQEIAGLKEALTILDDDAAAFIQRGSSTRTLRGGNTHGHLGA